MLVGALALSGTVAGAPSWQLTRHCGKAGDGQGSLVGNLHWEVGDPQFVTMSEATAHGIAVQVGPYEFAPPDSHPTTKDVPCNVALSVAVKAGTAWSVHRQQTFVVRSGWTGYQVGPEYRFVCVATKNSRTPARLKCLHSADREAGFVSVGFTVKKLAP
jgi:hypothetical protein